MASGDTAYVKINALSHQDKILSLWYNAYGSGCVPLLLEICDYCIESVAFRFGQVDLDATRNTRSLAVAAMTVESFTLECLLAVIR